MYVRVAHDDGGIMSTRRLLEVRSEHIFQCRHLYDEYQFICKLLVSELNCDEWNSMLCATQQGVRCRGDLDTVAICQRLFILVIENTVIPHVRELLAVL